MLKIRLQRVGKKHEPVFRLVVCDSKNSVKSGNNLEVLGSYDARDKNETRIDGDKVNHWISKGAQLSDTVHNLLITKGIIKGKKINILPAMKVEEKQAEVVEEAKAKVVEDLKESLDDDRDTSEDVEVKDETPVEVVEDAIEVKEVELPAEAIDSGKEDSVEVKEEELPAETETK